MAVTSEQKMKNIMKKRERKSKNLEEKLEILNLLEKGLKISCVARNLSINEQTIICIKKK